MLGENLERWDGVGNEREGTDVYPWLTHVDVWQRPAQHYKAIFPQLKKKVLKNQIKKIKSLLKNKNNK